MTPAQRSEAARKAARARWAKRTAAFLVMLLVAGSASAQKHAPLPDKVLQAKTVFLLNDAGDGKAADALYEAVGSWGKYKVVQDRSKADLVIVLSNKSEYAYATSTGSGTRIGNQSYGTGSTVMMPARSYYLHIVDAASGESLWTEGRIMYWTPAKMVKLLVGRIKDRAKESR